MKRKGISPLIAAVLLIAFTISAAALSGPWLSDLMNNAQEGINEDTETTLAASTLGLKIHQISYNRTSSNISAVIENSGQEEISEISLGLLGERVAQRSYNTSIQSKGLKTLNIAADRPFFYNTIIASLVNYPVEKEAGIECLPEKDIVTYLRFDDEYNEPNYALDLAGYDDNGTLYGPTTGQAGIVGESYDFDGSDDRIEVSEPENLVDITVSFWANFDQLDSSSDDTIISTNGNPIGVEHDASYAWQTFTVVDGSTYFANTTENMDIDEWVHIASTYDGERLCIYITGESKDCNTSPSGDPTNENINIHIGSDDNDAENIDGKLDDIRIYNRSISNNEVDKLYNSRNKNHAINGCRLVS